MPGFGFGFGRRYKRPLSAAPAVPLSYTLLYDFESVGTATASNNVLSQHTGSRKVLHTAALQMVGTGANTATGANTLTNSTLDFASFSRVLCCVDLGDTPLNSVSTVRPRFVASSTNYTPQFDSANLLVNPAEAYPMQRGKVWVSFALADIKVTNFAGASIQSVGTTSKRYEVLVSTQTSGDNAPDIVVDAAVLPASYKPAILFTFDDGNDSQYTNLFPAMQSRGLVGTLFIPFNRIGLASRLTSAHVAAMKAAGWTIAVDSDPDDLPLTAYSTVAAAIAQLNAHRDAIIAAWGDTAGGAHLCYSYGRLGYPDAPVTYSTTCNGTTAINVGGTNAHGFLAPGMKVFESGTLLGEITALTGQATATVSNAIASGTRTLTFSACVRGLAATCNGTTTVTVSSTASLFAGMHVLGYTVPTGTKITSIDSSTQITVDTAIPATCVRVSCAYLDGEFWPTKVADALIAAGYCSGRTTVQGNAMASPYGLDKKAAIAMPAFSIDSTSNTAKIIAQMQANVLHGRDTMFYGHSPQSGDMAAHWNLILDAAQTLVSNGSAEVLGVAPWWAQGVARAAIS